MDYYKQITFDEFNRLKEGDVVYVKCGNQFFKSKIVSEPFFNFGTEEPDWEVETTNGFCDQYSLYNPCTYTIYTRDEAARIVELFDNILCEHNIKVPSPEDAEREPDNNAALYGTVYSALLDDVELALTEIISQARRDDVGVIPHEFSGDF